MRTLSSRASIAALVSIGAAVVWMGASRAQTPTTPGAPVQAQAGRGAGGGGRGAPSPGGRQLPSPTPRKHLLVLGMTRGYHHGSTSYGLGTFYKLGRESGIWDTEIKTDMEWVTKKPATTEAHQLDWFDAVALVNNTGDWKLDDEQKAALLSFVKEDGKGLVACHAALDANYNWPDYADLLGGWFSAHPWGTFDAPVIVEDQTFPAMQHFPKRLRLNDEMYSPKNWSRDKVNVLMRLDETQLNYVNPQYGIAATRPDKDQAIAWAKMYGKGRVFYSSLGHTIEAWDDPMIQKMYLEAVKWVMGRTEGSVTPHAKVN